MENSMEIPLKIAMELPYDPAIPTGYLSKWTKITISKRYLHSYVYCFINHNSQALKTI
jgi:hypothetical protein